MNSVEFENGLAIARKAHQDFVCTDLTAYKDKLVAEAIDGLIQAVTGLQPASATEARTYPIAPLPPITITQREDDGA